MARDNHNDSPLRTGEPVVEIPDGVTEDFSAFPTLLEN